MKTIRTWSMAIATSALLTYGLLSCTKSKDQITPEDTETTQANEVIQDDQSAQNENDELDNMSEDLFDENGLNQRLYAEPCVKITKETNKITFDFGTEGCKVKGRTRKGKMIIEYTGKYRIAGSIFTFTFDNYTVDGRKIEGTRVVTNKGNNTYEIKATNMKITFPDGSFSTWSSTRTRIWDTKGTPLNFNDDELKIYGTADGVGRNKKAYTAVVDAAKPLIIKLSCTATDRIFLPVSGELVVTMEKKKRTINYGSGECDKVVTVTLEGGTAISLELKQ